MAEEFNEAPLHFLSSKPFRPAPCVTLVAKKAQRQHWASLSPCCHSRPSHSQPTSTMTEGALVCWITKLPWHTRPKLQCKAISQLGPANGGPLLEALYYHHVLLLQVKPLPVAKTQPSQTLQPALQAPKGESSSASN